MIFSRSAASAVATVGVASSDAVCVPSPVAAAAGEVCLEASSGGDRDGVPAPARQFALQWCRSERDARRPLVAPWVAGLNKSVGVACSRSGFNMLICSGLNTPPAGAGDVAAMDTVLRSNLSRR